MAYTKEVLRHHRFLHMAFAGMLALMTALVILYAALSYLVWQSDNTQEDSRQVFSEAERLHILSTLSSPATVDIDTKEEILNNLDASRPTTTRSDEEKLRILETLR